MSFSISVYDVDPDSGESRSIELSSKLGGFESWGKEVYASRLAMNLGLSILPRLGSEGWIQVEGADLGRIRDEARLLHGHAEDLCGSEQPTFGRVDADGTRHNVVVGGPPHDDVIAAVRDRLENIIAAAEIALALGPGRGRLSIS